MFPCVAGPLHRVACLRSNTGWFEIDTCHGWMSPQNGQSVQQVGVNQRTPVLTCKSNNYLLTRNPLGHYYCVSAVLVQKFRIHQKEVLA